MKKEEIINTIKDILTNKGYSESSSDGMARAIAAFVSDHKIKSFQLASIEDLHNVLDKIATSIKAE